MKFYQLGFRYLQRKKGKTILLLIVLILVNSMILGTSMILRTTNESKQAMQEKTNSKIVAEITSKDSKITENEVNKMKRWKMFRLSTALVDKRYFRIILLPLRSILLRMRKI